MRNTHIHCVPRPRWCRATDQRPTRVQVLYFDRCPSHEAFLPRLRDLLAQAGIDDRVEPCRVESVEALVIARILSRARPRATRSREEQARFRGVILLPGRGGEALVEQLLDPLA